MYNLYDLFSELSGRVTQAAGKMLSPASVECATRSTSKLSTPPLRYETDPSRHKVAHTPPSLAP